MSEVHAEARQRAVILQVRAYAETDAIVTLFSERLGKVAFYARHTRGPKRKETLQPFYEIALELRRRIGSQLFTAQAIDISDTHLVLHDKLEQLAGGSCVLEAYRDLFHDGDADAEAFTLLLTTLKALESEPALSVLARFAPTLLAHVGYERPAKQAQTLAEFRQVVEQLEQVAGHRLHAHRFFLEVA